jgi:prepilin-type processing-associated H-X9-DG protein
VNDTGGGEIIMAENNDIPAGASARPSTRRKVWTIIAIIAAIASIVVMWLVVALVSGFKALARVDCEFNLRQIGLPCREYAESHAGHFPSTWVQLNFVGEDANWAKLLRCPRTHHEIGDWTNVDLWADYRLLPGRTTNDPPDTVLALEPLINHESIGANVLFVDGSTQWWPAARVLGTVGGVVTNGASKLIFH